LASEQRKQIPTKGNRKEWSHFDADEVKYRIETDSRGKWQEHIISA
jgi:hypothetical protein